MGQREVHNQGESVDKNQGKPRKGTSDDDTGACHLQISRPTRRFSFFQTAEILEFVRKEKIRKERIRDERKGREENSRKVVEAKLRRAETKETILFEEKFNMKTKKRREKRRVLKSNFIGIDHLYYPLHFYFLSILPFCFSLKEMDLIRKKKHDEKPGCFQCFSFRFPIVSIFLVSFWNFVLFSNSHRTPSVFSYSLSAKCFLHPFYDSFTNGKKQKYTRISYDLWLNEEKKKRIKQISFVNNLADRGYQYKSPLERKMKREGDDNKRVHQDQHLNWDNTAEGIIKSGKRKLKYSDQNIFLVMMEETFNKEHLHYSYHQPHFFSFDGLFSKQFFSFPFYKKKRKENRSTLQKHKESNKDDNKEEIEGRNQRTSFEFNTQIKTEGQTLIIAHREDAKKAPSIHFDLIDSFSESSSSIIKKDKVKQLSSFNNDKELYNINNVYSNLYRKTSTDGMFTSFYEKKEDKNYILNQESTEKEVRNININEKSKSISSATVYFDSLKKKFYGDIPYLGKWFNDNTINSNSIDPNLKMTNQKEDRKYSSPSKQAPSSNSIYMHTTTSKISAESKIYIHSVLQKILSRDTDESKNYAVEEMEYSLLMNAILTDPTRRDDKILLATFSREIDPDIFVQNIVEGARILTDLKDRRHQIKIKKSINEYKTLMDISSNNLHSLSQLDFNSRKLLFLEKSLEAIKKMQDHKIDLQKWSSLLLLTKEGNVLSDLMEITSTTEYFRYIQYLSISIILNLVLKSDETIELLYKQKNYSIFETTLIELLKWKQNRKAKSFQAKSTPDNSVGVANPKRKHTPLSKDSIALENYYSSVKITKEPEKQEHSEEYQRNNIFSGLAPKKLLLARISLKMSKFWKNRIMKSFERKYQQENPFLSLTSNDIQDDVMNLEFKGNGESINVIYSHDPQFKKINKLLAALGYNPFQNGKRPGQRGLRVLCIDGGGTKGIMALVVLKQLLGKVGNGKEVHELFDLICGTSTGGILASLLGMLKKPLFEVERLYAKLCGKIFSGHPVYSGIKLVSQQSYYDEIVYEEILREIVGEETLLDSLSKNVELSPRVFCLSLALKHNPPLLHIWRNYNYPIGSNSKNFGSFRASIADVIRATSAAPTYFAPVTINEEKFCDGALLANNPTATCLEELKVLYPGIPIECIVSIGTGKHPGERENVDNYSWFDVLSDLINCSTDTEETDKLLTSLLPDDIYFRFNPETIPFSLDESDPIKLQEMKLAAREYCTKPQVRNSLSVCANILRDGHKDDMDLYYAPLKRKKRRKGN